MKLKDRVKRLVTTQHWRELCQLNLCSVKPQSRRRSSVVVSFTTVSPVERVKIPTEMFLTFAYMTFAYCLCDYNHHGHRCFQLSRLICRVLVAGRVVNVWPPVLYHSKLYCRPICVILMNFQVVSFSISVTFHSRLKTHLFHKSFPP